MAEHHHTPPTGQPATPNPQCRCGQAPAGRHRATDDAYAGQHRADKDYSGRHRTGEEYEGRHRTDGDGDYVGLHRLDPADLSVWATAQQTQPVQRRGRYVPESGKHPARMLPAIAAQAIHAYTQPGDLVFDPMCGIGTTMVEAMHAGRDGLGIEYESRWANQADANIAHALTQGASGRGSVIRGDATRMASLLPAALQGQVALVITSPPYGSTVHGQVHPTKAGVHKSDAAYGTDKGNLAYRKGGLPALIDGFTQILTGCEQLLRPGGVVAVTARPYRIGRLLIDLPSAVVAAGAAAGLVPIQRIPVLLAGLRDDRLIGRPSFFQLRYIRTAITAGIPAQLIAHEDLLVLGKPRNSASSHEPTCRHHHDNPGKEGSQ